MRTATYTFDELSLRTHKHVAVAVVSGTADVDIEAGEIVAVRIWLHQTVTPAGGIPLLHEILPLTPLHDLVKAEVIAAWEGNCFDQDRPSSPDENDEHRLTKELCL